MRKFRNSVFVWVSLSFMAGILLNQWVGEMLLYGLAVAPVGFLVFFLLSRNSVSRWVDWGLRIFAALTLVLLGGCANSWRSGLRADDISHLIGKQLVLEGVTLTESRQGKFGQQVWVEAQFAEGEEKVPVSGKVILYINGSDSTPLPAHTHISASVRVKELTGKNTGYLDYLRRKGIHCAASTREVTLGETEKSLAWRLDQSRNFLNRKLEEKMKDPQMAALASAMLLGDKRNLDRETKQYFSSAGISHLLAVSGLHVGLIYLLLNFLTSFLPPGKVSRRLKGLLVLILLIGYALLTGAGPAVNRAVLMLAFVIIGQSFHQRIKSLNLVALAAFILLLVNPKILFDVGFQLSFSAVAGILLLTPPLSNYLQKQITFLPRKVADAIAVSVSAQLATAPLVILYFGQFPTYFLVSNLFLLPVATVAVWAGFIGLMICWIPYVSDLVFFVLELLLQTVTWCSEWIAGLPGATIQHWNFSDPGFSILLVSTLIFIGLLNLRNFKSLVRKVRSGSGKK